MKRNRNPHSGNSSQRFDMFRKSIACSYSKLRCPYKAKMAFNQNCFICVFRARQTKVSNFFGHGICWRFKWEQYPRITLYNSDWQLKILFEEVYFSFLKLKSVAFRSTAVLYSIQANLLFLRFQEGPLKAERVFEQWAEVSEQYGHVGYYHKSTCDYLTVPSKLPCAKDRVQQI